MPRDPPSGCVLGAHTIISAPPQTQVPCTVLISLKVFISFKTPKIECTRPTDF